MTVIPKVLSDSLVSAAKGVAKEVLGKLLTSVSGGNKSSIVPFRTEGHSNIICFVHGFCGDPLHTFNPLPNFIEQEEQLNGWDIISIGYSTDIMPNIGKGIWAATPDIKKISGYLKSTLEIILKKYGRVALIGHSMGGLVIQKTILKLDDITPIKHVLLFGTPSGGLKKAWLGAWFKNQVEDMTAGGKFITELRKEWDEKFKHDYPFDFKVVAGQMDEFVPEISSLFPFPDKFHERTAGNHISMVKPENISDTTYQIILSALLRDSKYLSSTNYVALNNLIASYHVTYNTNKNKIDKLDFKGLKDYVMAVEGIGKGDEAIKAIESSPLLETNTDLMGILGGRYKRRYLSNKEAHDLDTSISWYQKGLQLSQKNGNSMQIYYHAINLAFLNLMKNDQDRTETRKMAELAMEHANKAGNDDMWEYATKAEAFLYLNNLNAALECYKKAIEISGQSIREMNSMYMNAVLACNVLNKQAWQNDLLAIFNH